MKRINPILLLSLPFLLLASCSKDDTDPNLTGVNGDITFRIDFVPRTRVNTVADFTSTWEAGDEIGIFAVRRAPGSTGSLSATPADNYLNNVRLTYNGASWTVSDGPSLYFPPGTDVLDFYAYYPYDASATDPTAIAFRVKTNQNGMTNIATVDRSNYTLSDLLTAKSDNSGAGWGKGSTVSLMFSHALAMVQVGVPTEKAGPSENLKVMLRGVKSGAVLNLATISAVAGSEITLPATDNDATGITMHRVEQSGDVNYYSSYTYRALVPAQAIAAGNSLFLFDSGGAQFFIDAALGTMFQMAAGQAETFERTLYIRPVETVLIPAAGQTFTMGSPTGEPGRYTDETQHQVTFTNDFHMGTYEVTVSQYAAFLNAVGVAGVGNGTYATHDVSGYDVQRIFRVNEWGWTPRWNAFENRWEANRDTPMIDLTWYGAKAYADWAGGALPTEAQWEYACRAGTTTAYYFGDDATLLGDYGWYSNNSSSIMGPSPVGTKLPNAYGLYDMHGNADEWCSDWYNNNYGSDPVTDPTGPATGISRVVRGGYWDDYSSAIRSASRGYYLPDLGQSGLRVVFSAP